ncbi:nucleoside-diphosphate-sugar epimerase [Bradyrhizobium sp. LB7.1]
MIGQKWNVMVTGGAGYVGSVLVPHLLAAGHKVTVLDLFMYGDDVFDAVRNNPNLRLIKGDIRDEAAINEALRGNDAVIHLACISNDPSFELDPGLGKSINYDCFRPMVRAAKKAGIKRFIYASSSSVYGIKDEAEVTEDLSCEPLTDYSKFKAMCETDLADEAASGFVACTVRPATVCGYAPRQRLDVVVNILTNLAVNTGPHPRVRGNAAPAQSAHRGHVRGLSVPAPAGRREDRRQDLQYRLREPLADEDRRHRQVGGRQQCRRRR